MDSLLLDLFGAAAFVPHGYCLLWRPDLVAMHAVSDGVIALTYFSIPAAIFAFVRRRPDFRHYRVASLFILFIMLCGITHAVGVWTLWQPVYGLQGLVKVLTATVSLITAIALWPLLPELLAQPSPALLNGKAERLEAEIRRRELVELALRAAHGELEQRVAERTCELAAAKAEAEHAALHDGLTHLGNRRLLQRQLDASGRRESPPPPQLHPDRDRSRRFQGGQRQFRSSGGRCSAGRDRPPAARLSPPALAAKVGGQCGCGRQPSGNRRSGDPARQCRPGGLCGQACRRQSLGAVRRRPPCRLLTRLKASEGPGPATNGQPPASAEAGGFPTAAHGRAQHGFAHLLRL